MIHDDTIAAISTAPGVGAIAIVRLSGPHAFSIAQKIFFPRSFSPEAKNEKWLPKSHQATIGYIRKSTDEGGFSDDFVDEVVLIPYQGPNSYTGEDLVEINCHGSPIVTREILTMALESGARLAQKGEFTKRGFLSGRLDLTQAEAVLDLIHSKTERQSHLALSALKGALGDEIKAVRARLMELTTRLVAGIDFPEEVGELDISDVEKIVDEAIARLETLARTARSGRYLREGLKLAIVGRPNAGKSSLLNALLNFERAIVTDVPGTTRDSIEEPVDVNGVPVILIDTAGMRTTDDAVEQIGIERSNKAIDEAELVVLLIDGEKAAGHEEEVIAKKLLAVGRNFLPVINKSDLIKTEAGHGFDLKAGELLARALAAPICASTPVQISARNGLGLEDLKKLIERFAISDQSLQELGGSLNQRQGELCHKSLAHLAELKTAAASGLPQDCLVTDLRSALDALDEISGETVTEEVITEVFANFCIGK
ncbi:MAG: tRNA uridine-5-carboxymethylaminomethyl(34) synthesis GTPase MnmE [Cyanobacteria bacterium SZAS TMP-1]|nr:tRNA uridine-5-carboxymethylaminomethyl(34) synthesis GTPase MnmE [Cyanobacteria bacterium SZAS TMP-1]